MTALRVGSLFSGIGAFDRAAERAGMALAWQAEIEPHASAVLAKRFPGVPNLGDVTKIENPPPVDIVTFGSPCQGFSVAGRRGGLADERSGLFGEAVRIIGRVRPALAIWEAVPGTQSTADGRDFLAALDALAGVGALDIGWRVLDSQYVGGCRLHGATAVPQRRRRIFVVVDFAARRAGQILALPEGGAGDSQARGTQGQDVAYCLAASVRGTGDGHGNAWNTTYAVAGYHENQTSSLVESDVARALRAVATPQAGYTAAGIPKLIRRLMPVETERLMGFPDGWTCLFDHPQPCDCPDGARYRCCGNAIVVPVLDWLFARIARQCRPAVGNEIARGA